MYNSLSLEARVAKSKYVCKMNNNYILDNSIIAVNRNAPNIVLVVVIVTLLSIL